MFRCVFLMFTLSATLVAVVGQKLSATAQTGTVKGNHTWFIRADGGDRTQCTGDADAPYRGHGAGQRCAFKHPYYLFTDDRYGNKAWVIRGGDIVLLRGGPYRMGYRGPNPKDYWGSCPGEPYGCSMPPIPSGSDVAHTKILGEHYAHCDAKTELFGGYALSEVINLRGSRNVDLECLELTDHEQCSRVGAQLLPGQGCSSSYPLSDYASTGIVTDAGTASVLFKNLDIHGFTSRGIIGPIGGRVDVDHVRIGFNGSAGWDFDDGNGTRSQDGAKVVATDLTVEWNGCNEEYPIRHAVPVHNCFDQDSGGYGDGVGTPDTNLSFDCVRCVFRYNTQDGLDLLHAAGGVVRVVDSISYGNMGQQWKIGAMRTILFQNNITVNNCRRLSADMPGAPTGFNQRLSLFCRAAGEGVAVSVRDDGTYIFRNNSFAGYGATSYGIECSGKCGNGSIIYQNNLLIGYVDPATGLLPGAFYSMGFSGSVFKIHDHNLYFRVRKCPWGEKCADPKIVNLPEWHGEQSLDGIDFRLTASSPARGAGACSQAKEGNPAVAFKPADCDIGATR